MTSASPGPSAVDPLLHIEQHRAPHVLRERLAHDVRRGLVGRPKRLPPKYFYDDRGSQLFDAICDLPEYYLTRTEHALLRRVAGAIIAMVAPSHLIELGSGASRKTRVLLDALQRDQARPVYVPIDVSGGILRQSASALRAAYPRLRVHGLVADFEDGLPSLPRGRRLVAYLGSSIGNFEPPHDERLLGSIAARLQPGDALLLGVDLVKAAATLEAAYDDAAGLTAEFNRNILRVLNRELGADFRPDRFDHVAFFNADAAQVEMHLRAREAHAVSIAALDLVVEFTAGETIHTECSRKFTRPGVEGLLARSGFRLARWDESPDAAFALALGCVGSVA
ncbi:L-histidine N(alpha)-methyltransferase [bacterium]|nr:L-histidine N(alpha)-methyltransferase [bacterium]